MKHTNKLISAAVLSAAALACGNAFADPVACAGSATDTGDQGWTYFSGLNAGGGCFQQDKLYSNFSTSGNYGDTKSVSDLIGRIAISTTANNTDYHTVKWSTGSGVTGAEFFVNYTITVLNSTRIINQITLGADIPIVGAYANVNANAGTYTLHTTGATIVANSSDTSLVIIHEIDSGTGGISSSTATYVENPEPGSLAIFGLGLAGLGLIRRRMAAKAA